MRRLVVIAGALGLVWATAQAQVYRPGFEPFFRPGFKFSSSSIPSWVPGQYAGASMYMSGSRANGDGTYCSIWIPAENYNGSCAGKIARVATGGTAFDASGNVVPFTGNALRATNNGLTTEAINTNIFLNSATPATQTIAVTSGNTYAVQVHGTGSLVLTGALTGTVTAGNPLIAVASTTALVATVVGTITYPMVANSGAIAAPIVSGATATSQPQDQLTFSDISWFTGAPAGLGMGGKISSEFVPVAASRVLEINDGTNSNRLILDVNASGTPRMLGVGAGTTLATASTTAITANTFYKVAGSFTPGSSAAAISENGAAPVNATGPAGAVTGLNASSIGMEFTGSAPFSGVIQQLWYFPSAQAGAQLQAQSTLP